MTTDIRVCELKDSYTYNLLAIFFVSLLILHAGCDWSKGLNSRVRMLPIWIQQ